MAKLTVVAPVAPEPVEGGLVLPGVWSAEDVAALKERWAREAMNWSHGIILLDGTVQLLPLRIERFPTKDSAC